MHGNTFSFVISLALSGPGAGSAGALGARRISKRRPSAGKIERERERERGREREREKEREREREREDAFPHTYSNIYCDKHLTPSKASAHVIRFKHNVCTRFRGTTCLTLLV